jgi:predicted TPR repeat methyltransferase
MMPRMATMAAYDEAKALQAKGDLDGAAAGYRRAIEADAADYRALHNLGTVLEALGDAPGAEASYVAAIAAHPAGALSHYSLARLRQLANDFEEAEGGYRRAIELDPDFAEAHFNLGQLLLERGDARHAEAALREAVRAGEGAPAATSLLGDALFAQRRLSDALAAYRQTAEQVPDDPVTQYDLGKTLEFLKRTDEAILCYRKSLDLEPASAAAHEGLVRALEAAGRREEALATLRDWLARDPDQPVARHMLASLGGAEAPARAADDYVENTFDRFAGDFDATLARLEYRAPQLVMGAAAVLLGEPQGDLDVLDAGCGTGLAGPMIRPWAKRLEGVDLSGEMLLRAHRRGGYDALHHAELLGFLSEQEAAWDLIVSADTFCYFGALEELLAAAAKALKPGGALVFTVERLLEGAGFRLHAHGRYAHEERYVNDALAAAGFEITPGRGALRLEGGVPVEGLVMGAKRNYF